MITHNFPESHSQTLYDKYNVLTFCGIYPQLQDFEKKEDNLRMARGKDYPFDYFFHESARQRQEAREVAERLVDPGQNSGSNSDSHEEGGVVQASKVKNQKKGKHGKKLDTQVKSRSKGHSGEEQTGPQALPSEKGPGKLGGSSP